MVFESGDDRLRLDRRMNGCSSVAPPTYILDLFVEESRRSVYAGELDMCPPDAPTIRTDTRAFPQPYRVP